MFIPITLFYLYEKSVEFYFFGIGTDFTMYIRSLVLLCVSNLAIAGPWMTGPLLAPSGKTIPAGHFNFEPYGFYTSYPAGFRNIEAVPILSVGITDFLDIQTTLPFDYSWDKGQNGEDIGDFSLGFGLQVLRQKEGSWLPDLRFVVQEVFPTGRFERLSPDKFGTDQTGVGSYQTFLGLNFQQVSTLPSDHYLRTRLSLTAALPADVSVEGVNVFGGTSGTKGNVRPGNSYAVDLAFEYSLTQHWVPVFEALYATSSTTNFNGNPGFTPGGTLANVGGRGGNQASLAPALEYNFTSNLGVIGGVWFSVTGPHAAKFVSAALAVNYYQ